MDAPTETEFKLRAHGSLEVAAVDAALRELAAIDRTSSSQHSDLYLDDAAGSLQRAGIGLRLRRSTDRAELCVKTRARIADGRFDRLELAVAWPTAEAPRFAHELPAALRDQVEPFVLLAPLAQRLELRVHRDLRVVRCDDRPVCELVVDHVEAFAADRSFAFAEIELEVLEDAATVEQLAQALRARLPLVPAEEDKPSHALRRLGLSPSSPGPTLMLPETPLGTALQAIVGNHLATLRRAEARVRSEPDPEALHTLRVALRRLRSLVRSCRDAWASDAAEQALGQLAEFARACGPRRDLDVLLATVQDGLSCLPPELAVGHGAVVERLAAERAQVDATLQERLRHRDHLEAMHNLTGQLDRLDDERPQVEEPLAVALPMRLARACDRLRRLLRTLPADLPLPAVHELRLASKRLRYLAEEFVDVPGHDYARSLEVVVTLQQALGSVCDHAAAATRLAQLALGEGVTGSEAAALGGLATWQLQRGRAARRKATKALADVDRKKVWRRFPEPVEPTDDGATPF